MGIWESQISRKWKDLARDKTKRKLIRGLLSAVHENNDGDDDIDEDDDYDL